ncbi:hypothetical protein CSA08_02220 [Candidatus Gracilibacteria bacterium]|nr:MAG: hypothetical protein CSA08_02220 [Candidatus Gracilibacteria bacterium]
MFVILNRACEISSNKNPSTSNVTSLYNHSWIRNLGHLLDFSQIKDFIILIIEKDIPFNLVTGMQFGLGLPDTGYALT